uniref:Uncharacterized protein n=1 Tax=Candidatus Kentrum eta TaxID=2126337 RepID=A0A450VMX1_9GAMM|nr:MAG: hypothetical protein BECKH772B_GA0070898_103043 [Candidatus Kentron sp. H]VFK03570.1 MAG: hypothetical protein BECKH772A_GA0070896_103363 [Candidatus Kentron sp. H]VFK05719.1 MAG: hypothetical protein BECKH772C_GA0070978_102973 [Candidatus Kentron sp. H]VFK06060.1 MAG: hypothetical protein BECKH772B_GA0070898_106451 [Candidatus Kentron sp. H]VFK09205.1 MAG: hypothetical protein BECKH772C_GA0070978_105861 [Candidatus Kentron sp. H]
MKKRYVVRLSAEERERSRVLDGEGEARLVSLACMSHLKDNLAGLYGCWESDWWNWR